VNSIQKLADLFSRFPGIGPRQSVRFVYFLLHKDSAYLEELSRLIRNIKSEISICSECFRHFNKNHDKTVVCSICANIHRDKSKLMIVARDSDLESINKTKAYNGLYFVLGGTIPILDPNPDKTVRMSELTKKISQNNQLKEIIIAMSANPDGENTEDVLKNKLRETAESRGIKVTRLGRGLSTGVELEYSDSDTLKSALAGRKE
jgi:recombination protein RecR